MSKNETDVLIEFKKIHKKFGDLTVLNEIDLKINKQTIHALVGENGAGKSTLMKILVGIEKPTSGVMNLRGQQYAPVNVLDSVHQKIGLVHQHFQLADELTGVDHLHLVSDILRLKRENAIAKAESLLKQFHWSIPLNKKIKHYSVGEQQRIEILRVLLSEPEIIIFDEPTAVLSPTEVSDFLNFLKELKLTFI